MLRSSFCFRRCGCAKSCHPSHVSPPSWKGGNCFWQRKQTLPILCQSWCQMFFQMCRADCQIDLSFKRCKEMLNTVSEAKSPFDRWLRTFENQVHVFCSSQVDSDMNHSKSVFPSLVHLLLYLVLCVHQTTKFNPCQKFLTTSKISLSRIMMRLRMMRAGVGRHKRYRMCPKSIRSGLLTLGNNHMLHQSIPAAHWHQREHFAALCAVGGPSVALPMTFISRLEAPWHEWKSQLWSKLWVPNRGSGSSFASCLHRNVREKICSERRPLQAACLQRFALRKPIATIK